MGAAAGINFLLTAAFAPHIPAELVFYRRILIGAYKNILWAPRVRAIKICCAVHDGAFKSKGNVRRQSYANDLWNKKARDISYEPN